MPNNNREETTRRPRKVLQLATQSATAYRFVLPIAKHLRRKNFAVSVGCSDEVQPDVPDFHQQIRAAGFDLKIVPIPRRIEPWADLRALRDLVGLLRREGYDFVHTHNSKAGLIGRAAAKLAGVPYVIHTNHGLPFFKAGNFSWYGSLFYWLLEFVAARFCHRILAVSQAEFAKAETFKVAKPPKLVEVGQGLNTSYYSRAAVAALPKSAMVDSLQEQLRDCVVLGTVGRLVPEKGLDILVEAAARCLPADPRLRVLIVGDGPERAALEERVAALHLASKFVFLGSIADQDEVRRIYSLFDIFVLPTRWESFGMVFAEAMALEIPVIGTDIEPIKTVVANGETGILVPLDDAAALAEAMRQLAADPKLRREMGKAGRRRVLALWDEDRMAERIADVYEDLLARG